MFELIAVILIVSVIGVYVANQRNSVSWAQLQTSRDNLVAALFYAQQVAMSRDDVGSQVTFVASNADIRIQVNNANIGTDYPFSFINGIVLSNDDGLPLTLNYDKLGRTTATTFTLSGGGSSIDVNVSSSGYAY
jgi:MSHA pilin protein MshC